MNHWFQRLIHISFTFLFLFVSNAVDAQDEGPISHRVYLIGDVGDDTLNSSAPLQLLKKHLSENNTSNNAVVFLGDNIYPVGMHKKSHPSRAEDEQRINIQMDAVKDFKGEVFFIPGNHDWEQTGNDGDKYLRRQEKYVQKYLDRGNIFRPSKGCPGPDVIELGDDLVLILIDTQWWIHPHDKPSGEKDDCDVLDQAEFMVSFREALKKYRRKNVLVSGHHPLYTNGKHGGYFPLKYHLFPLTEVNHDLYIPLPILGSIYPFYRGLIGDRQDLAHPIYQDMRRSITEAIDEYQNVVYVAGHEHNLQYWYKNDNHYLVSGSGSKSSPVKLTKQMEFASKQKGFLVLNYYVNGKVWADFVAPGEEGRTHQLMHKKLYEKEVLIPQEDVLMQEKAKKSYAGQYRKVVPNAGYRAGKFKRLIFGDLNRDIWTDTVEVPLLDINFEKGGLEPIKKGGGMQTISLRLQGGDGKQYVLRGISKDATFLLPKNLRNTVSKDVVYDGIAGSHPYGAIAIPALSEPAGIYYTNPKLVVVPDDPILGEYREEFAGMFCLFEERPDDDMSEMASVGGSKDVINYSKTIERVHGKYKHQVDRHYITKARLFDMFIGDWDRHDDQWRWATFKEEGKTIYRPIPRDRDQAFFKFDGLVPNISNRKWLLRKFQNFKEDIRDIEGQNFNARYFDRSFLTEVSRDEWIATANELKQELTDPVIEAAIKQFPEAAFKHNGEFLIKTLKARRDNLDRFARRYYDILSQNVDVVGTLKSDYFEVIRNEDGSVEVNVYPLKKAGVEKEGRYYHRVFKRNETKEIRLYGLDGKDEYHISGEVKKSIKLRIVGGESKDSYQDDSKVASWGKKTLIYESLKGNKNKDNNKFENSNNEARVFLRKETEAYQYNRKEFKYNNLTPLPSFGFNPDDGFFWGAGFNLTTHGFKKFPYKSNQSGFANVSTRTSAFNIGYDGHFIDVFGKWDFDMTFRLNAPLIFNYNGPGNESQKIEELGQTRIRQQNVFFNPSIKQVSKSGSTSFSVGLDVQNVEFVDLESEDLERFNIVENFQGQTFVGARMEFDYANKDNPVNPWRGIHYNFAASWHNSIDIDDIAYLKLESFLAIYSPLYFMPLKSTLAFRIGGARNIGDYPFFQSNFLSGLSEMRGIRRNRYAGESSAYGNLELRMSLLKVKNYVAPFDLGVIGHGDIGRVWLDGEDSQRWHNSVGGGIFLNFLDFIVVSTTYSVSDDDEMFLVLTRFMF